MTAQSWDTEGLRGYEATMGAGRQRLAQRGRQIHDLHDGGPGTLGTRPDAPPDPLVAGAEGVRSPSWEK